MASHQGASVRCRPPSKRESSGVLLREIITGKQPPPSPESPGSTVKGKEAGSGWCFLKPAGSSHPGPQGRKVTQYGFAEGPPLPGEAALRVWTLGFRFLDEMEKRCSVGTGGEGTTLNAGSAGQIDSAFPARKCWNN